MTGAVENIRALRGQSGYQLKLAVEERFGG
jgi:hypothetical protein